MTKQRQFQSDGVGVRPPEPLLQGLRSNCTVSLLACAREVDRETRYEVTISIEEAANVVGSASVSHNMPAPAFIRQSRHPPHSEPQRRVRVRNPPKPKSPISSSFPCPAHCPGQPCRGGHMETTRKARGSFLCTAAGVFHAEISSLLRVRRGRTDAPDPDDAHFPGMQRVGSNVPSADDDRRKLLASPSPSGCLPDSLPDSLPACLRHYLAGIRRIAVLCKDAPLPFQLSSSGGRPGCFRT